jgi:hypothetical protein
MKNKLTDLNDHLFSQLERLSQEGISSDDLQKEIERSKAVTCIAKDIVSNASLQLKALELKAEYQGLDAEEIPALLTGQS